MLYCWLVSGGEGILAGPTEGDSPLSDIPDLSIVIPVYNERETLEELHSRLTAVLEKMARPYEVIMVDDGSTDGSFELLCRMNREDGRIRVLRLARNFGQSPALYAGFSKARGRYVFILDADLQVLPEDLPLLVAKLDEGFDAVSGWRANRKDTFFRKVASKLLNRYIAGITGLSLHDYGCSLKGIRRELVEHMVGFSHRCRYLPVDLAMLGGRFAEVVVGHSERTRGTSKYGMLKLVRTAFDLITGITDAPLRYIGLLGWLMSFAGFAMGIKVAAYRLMYGNVNQLESVVALFFFCSGVQLVATGMMCEYIGRIFVEVQRRPYYVVAEER